MPHRACSSTRSAKRSSPRPIDSCGPGKVRSSSSARAANAGPAEARSRAGGRGRRRDPVGHPPGPRRRRVRDHRDRRRLPGAGSVGMAHRASSSARRRSTPPPPPRGRQGQSATDRSSWRPSCSTHAAQTYHPSRPDREGPPPSRRLTGPPYSRRWGEDARAAPSQATDDGEVECPRCGSHRLQAGRFGRRSSQRSGHARPDERDRPGRALPHDTHVRERGIVALHWRMRLVHALASCASHHAIHSTRPSTVTWCSCGASRWLLELHHGHLNRHP
jgi:hypothetical protein